MNIATKNLHLDFEKLDNGKIQINMTMIENNDVRNISFKWDELSTSSPNMTRETTIRLLTEKINNDV